MTRVWNVTVRAKGTADVMTNRLHFNYTLSGRTARIAVERGMRQFKLNKKRGDSDERNGYAPLVTFVQLVGEVR